MNASKRWVLSILLSTLLYNIALCFKVRTRARRGEHWRGAGGLPSGSYPILALKFGAFWGCSGVRSRGKGTTFVRGCLPSSKKDPKLLTHAQKTARQNVIL